MFQKISFFFTALLIFFSLQSQAQYLGLEIGVRQQSASTDINSTTVNSNTAYQFGGTGAVAITEKLLFRSGFMYTQRPISLVYSGYATGNVTYNYQFSYLDVPVTLMWKFTDYGGIYAGVDLALAVAASCDNCTANDPNGFTPPNKTTITPVVFGGSFKFAPDFGVDVYYEMASKIVNHITSASAVGANLLITFD